MSKQDDLQFLLERAVFTPPETAAIGVSQVGQRREGQLPLGIAELDDYFAPTLPGNLVGVLGQTHMGKSLFMHHVEAAMANQLKLHRPDQMVVHVSFEESIEDISLLTMAKASRVPLQLLTGGKVDAQGLGVAIAAVSDRPIFYVAESLSAPATRDARSVYRHLTLENVSGVVREMEERLQLKAAAVFLDYLQAIPAAGDREEERRLEVRRNTYDLRILSAELKAPVWVGIQAKQELRGVRFDKQVPVPMLPGMYDGEETSAIAQRMDRLLSLWMPSKSYSVGTQVALSPDPSDLLTVSYNQMLVKVLKQRGNLPSGRAFLFNIDFETSAFRMVKSYG